MDISQWNNNNHTVSDNMERNLESITTYPLHLVKIFRWKFMVLSLLGSSLNELRELTEVVALSIKVTMARLPHIIAKSRTFSPFFVRNWRFAPYKVIITI